MIERVRIAAQASRVDYAARFGYEGRTIASYLDEFGGFDGYLEDPYGTRPWISLRAFDGADPALFLKIMFIVPANPGDDLPPMQSDVIVLGEYALAEGAAVLG